MTLVLMLSMNSAFTQNKAVINHCVNNSEIHGPAGVICSNENRTKWFTLTPNYKLDGTRLFCTGLVVIKTSIGDVNKTGTLVFTFKDGNKIRLKSGIIPNIDGALYFELTELDFIILKSKEIDTVRFINGIDNVSFQYKMVGDESNYYINLFTNYTIHQEYCK